MTTVNWFNGKQTQQTFYLPKWQNIVKFLQILSDKHNINTSCMKEKLLSIVPYKTRIQKFM